MSRRKAKQQQAPDAAELARAACIHVVADICTAATPERMVHLMEYLANPFDIPQKRRRDYWISSVTTRLTESMLTNCTFAGGGTDGYVLFYKERLFNLAHVMKVREVTAGHTASVGREIAGGIIAHEFAMPFVASMIDWNVWDGVVFNSDAPKGYMRVSKAISDRMRKHVFDFVEFIPDAVVRKKIFECWFRSAIIPESDKHMITAQFNTSNVPDDAERAELRYIEARIKYMQMARYPQRYITMIQADCGKENLTSRILIGHPDGVSTIEESWTTTANWHVFSSHILCITQMLYALQQCYGMQHGDAQTGNIALRKLTDNRLPREYKAIWVPVLTRDDNVRRDALKIRPITAEDLGGYVPTFIDLSTSSFDTDLVCEYLHMKPGTQKTKSYFDACIARTLSYSRTTDIRRIGLYMAWAAWRNCHHPMVRNETSRRNCQQDQTEWTTMLHKAFDWRYINATLFMLSIPRYWLELVCSRPDLAQDEVKPPNILPPASKTLEEFVRNMLRLQDFLQCLLRILHPSAGRATMPQELQRLSDSNMHMKAVLSALIRDLNPHIEYLLTKCNWVEQVTDPLLPENLVRSSIWVEGMRA